MGLRDAIARLQGSAEQLANDTEEFYCYMVERRIRALGMTCSRREGEWRINYHGAPETCAYYTTDNEDGVRTAEVMAKSYVRFDKVERPKEG